MCEQPAGHRGGMGRMTKEKDWINDEKMRRVKFRRAQILEVGDWTDGGETSHLKKFGLGTVSHTKRHSGTELCLSEKTFDAKRFKRS